MHLDRVSIEPSRRCSKACSFCYNGSSPAGEGQWSAAQLIDFARDLAAHGVAFLSLGGGEALEWEGTFEVLRALEGVLMRSLTTNGLPLQTPACFEALVAARPDKVHVSLHNPRSRKELARVQTQVQALAAAGIASGVNLLVRRSELVAARRAALRLARAGIDSRRVVYLPMQGSDTPTPTELAQVAGAPFQSMSCLGGCARSPRFASIGADRSVAWCSYTRERRVLREPTHAGLMRALDGLGLHFCGEGQLVRLGRGAGHETGANTSSGEAAGA